MITVTVQGTAIEVTETGGKVSNYALGSVQCVLQSGKIYMRDSGDVDLHQDIESNWTPNTLAGLRALGIFSAAPVNIDPEGLATEDKQDDAITELQTLNASISAGINVTVLNPSDLSTIEAALTSVVNDLGDIEANTAQQETQLNTIISEIQANGTLNNTNLLAVIGELQNIDANTDQQETLLNSIVSNTSGVSTAANQTTLIGSASSIDDKLTDQAFLSKYSDLRGEGQSVDVYDFQANSVNQTYALIGIRLRVGTSGVVKLSNAQGFVETNDNFRLQIIKNPTSVTNPQPFTDNWQYVQTNQGLGGGAGGASIITGGEVKHTFPRKNQQDIDDRIDIFLTAGDEYYLAVTPIGANADLFLAINAREYAS